MSVARRIVLVPLGLALAIPCGLLFLLVGGSLDAASRQLVGNLTFSSLLALAGDIGQSGALEAISVLFFGLMLIGSIVLIAPLILVALVGEIIGLRTYVWYSGGCAALTGAIPWVVRGGPLSGGASRDAIAAVTAGELRITLLLLLTGAASGFVYWLVAGKSAGPLEAEPADFPGS
jgi:hypothetical protein